MLTREKNIVHETTMGLQDGPTTQHAVLTTRGSSCPSRGGAASFDKETPEQGIGILIPAGMEYDALIDFIYEHVKDLEFALEEKSMRVQTAVKKEHQRLRREQKKKKKGGTRRRGHFYQYEVNTIFRKRLQQQLTSIEQW
ncbi:hypothetical protein PR003_g8677 [Phytophthora rubi]|uniref:Uncharacterized protein n=1 Tax=Phytophthora rubi TaxID=129364 RepID=A0A6A3K1Q0_9STRA|nr:hypothetical protein PR002_g18409 [Phytophthora rubi]KAE9038410.1 hypothetical protein PR001_g7963 [Phytophthora rubi]KAE9344012.1 hypothetical protein PR003_g8677 [Phytophthora rubi]